MKKTLIIIACAIAGIATAQEKKGRFTPKISLAPSIESYGLGMAILGEHVGIGLDYFTNFKSNQPYGEDPTKVDVLQFNQESDQIAAYDMERMSFIREAYSVDVFLKIYHSEILEVFASIGGSLSSGTAYLQYTSQNESAISSSPFLDRNIEINTFERTGINMGFLVVWKNIVLAVNNQGADRTNTISLGYRF